MGLYQKIRDIWKKPKVTLGKVLRERVSAWRKEPVIVGMAHPTRIDRARALGYRAKDGFTIARVQVKKGGRKRPKAMGGRKPSKTGRLKYTTKKSLQMQAEEKVQRKYPNMEVLNSYWVGEDGKSKWYEVILVDPFSHSIEKDKTIGWIVERQHKKRVHRGLTSSGKKSKNI